VPAHSRARAAAGATRFLDPSVLARIDNLDLLARTVVDGFLSGLHRSPHLGFSTDFAEHRPYMPGDDIRRMDWKLFARTDRHYIKLFEAETNADVALLVDVSGSMAYGSHEVSKIDYARYLAASLAYFGNRQRDRVGLVTFDHDVVAYIPPSARHLDMVLHRLDAAEPGRPGSLGPPLLTATERLRKKGIVVLVSDFYEPPDDVMAAVGPLAARGHDVLVFHVLDPTEIDFPFEDASSFEDLETGEQIPVVPEKLRADYTRLVGDHVTELRERFTAQRVDYRLLDTSRPLDEALFAWLSMRGRLQRKP
jgi:uncharacterized protein (DUF58 family)